MNIEAEILRFVAPYKSLQELPFAVLGFSTSPMIAVAILSENGVDILLTGKPIATRRSRPMRRAASP